MGSIQQTPQQQQWLKDRMGSVGASEAAAVLGLHPWLSPIQVWVSKVFPELVEPRDSFLLKLGTRLEPVIAACYEDQTGTGLTAGVRIVHPRFPEISASPDRVTLDLKRLVELKSCNEFAKDKFGDFGSQDVPEAYLVQAWVQMEVCGIPACDIAALIGGANFGVYPIPEDKEVQQAIIDQLREWWHKYVVAKKEPPIDASQGWADYIARRYPRNDGGMVKVNEADHHEIIEAASNYALQRAEEKEHGEQKDFWSNHIKEFIGSHDGLLLPGDGKITYKRSKDTVDDVTNWQALALQVAEDNSVLPAVFERMVDQHTLKNVVLRQGSRRFIFTEGK